MAPVLRSRTSLPPSVTPAPVTPAPERRKLKPKPKPKPKPKQKPQTSARKQVIEEDEVRSRNRSADAPLVHGQSVSGSSPLLTHPLCVSLIPDARAIGSGSSATPKAGPPFIFHYNGVTVLGGTFEQRAAVIMSALDSQSSPEVQGNRAIGEDSPSYGRASLTRRKRA